MGKQKTEVWKNSQLKYGNCFKIQKRRYVWHWETSNIGITEDQGGERIGKNNIWTENFPELMNDINPD